MLTASQPTRRSASRARGGLDAHCGGGTPVAGQPPFALDGTVTRDKLVELLAVQAELATLDYKRECDLSGAAGTTELVKDIGAMGILGGYLVVGADDSGGVTGLPAGQAALFDQATLSAKAAQYLPAGLELRSAVHAVDHSVGPQEVALVWVGPHPDGWCVFTRDGTYVDGSGKNATAFRAGQVYARHGTRSEPWDQGDIAAARTALVARATDAWRAEHREETQRALQDVFAGASVAVGPSGAFTWQLDAAGFEAATVELLRRNDDVPVRRMLRAAAAEAQRLLLKPGTTDTGDLTVLLDRVAALAAVGLDLRRPAFLDLAVRTLLGLYGWAVQDLRVHTSAHQLTPVLWLRIAERLYAVGALAVRLQDWRAIRGLALAPVPQLAREYRTSSWHRDALTQASRARLFTRPQPDGRTAELSLLLFARAAAAAAQPVLRPDLPGEVSSAYAGPDPLLDSLCQFDLLLTVVSGAAAGAESERALLDVSYPSYAHADGSRANAVVPTLVLDLATRQALVPDVTDHQLAVVLQLADQVAHREGQRFWGWEGYTDPAVQAFVQNHLAHA